MRHKAVIAFWMILAVAAGCSSKKEPAPQPSPPVPAISDINSVTDPKSPVGLPIEINGSDFGGAPGYVRFVQSGITAEVTPDSSGWTDTGIVAVVPAGDGTSSFTVPGTVTVYVITVGGASNGVDLDLVQVPAFNPDNIAWGASTALPAAKTGLRAVAVGDTSTHAFLYVSGGQTAAGNSDEVLSLELNVSGTSFSAGASWGTQSSLPAATAFHAMAVADPGNSSVSAGNAYLYVLGGQASAADAPGGTTTVHYASVNPSTGAVGSWTETAALPQARIGHTALVSRGRLFVLGGLDSTGTPTDTIWCAPVNSDGSLGAFATVSSPLATAIGFHASFAFGSNLYILGGRTTASTNPNDTAIGGESAQVYRASFVRGEIGAFSSIQTLIKAIKNHTVFNAFGQVILGEGIYAGWVPLGSTELTKSDILPDGSLAAFVGLTGARVPAANVFNCAGAMSPIFPDNGGPRFFIIGGMDSSGNRGAGVWVNTAP